MDTMTAAMALLKRGEREVRDQALRSKLGGDSKAGEKGEARVTRFRISCA
jgi:hypothetical protein